MLTFNPQDPFSCFVTQSLSMKSAVENAQRFAMFDVPLLIQGETGTGKDLLAKKLAILRACAVRKNSLRLTVLVCQMKMRKAKCLGVKWVTVKPSVLNMLTKARCC